MTKTVPISIDDLRSILHNLEAARYKIACDGHIGKDDKMLLFKRLKECTDRIAALLQPRLL